MAKTTVPIELSSTPSIVDNGDATAITINSSEQVGIGGTPFYSLDVQGSATDYEGLRVLNTNTAASPTTSAILLGVANSVRNVYTKIQTIEGGSDANETRLAFFTNNPSNNLTEALRIDENQNVGIGITNPSDYYASWNDLVLGSTSAAGGMTIVAGTGSDGTLAFADGTTGDAEYRGYIQYAHSGDSLRIGTSGTEKMRIDSSGHLLINNTGLSSLGTLVMQQTADSQGIAIVDSTGTNTLFIENDGTFNKIRNNDAIPMAFYTNSAERMRIDSSGRLLVGSTATDPIASNTDGLSIGDSGDGRIKQFHNGARHTLLVGTGTSGVGTHGVGFYYHNGTSANEKGNIVINTGSVSYNTTSDYRLKENVTYDWDATTRLKQLKPARFNFIEDADTTVDGFLAHEVSSIVPEAIHGEKDAVDDEGNAVYQGIDQSKLVPLLVKTIQELEARITALEGN